MHKLNNVPHQLENPYHVVSFSLLEL